MSAVAQRHVRRDSVELILHVRLADQRLAFFVQSIGEVDALEAGAIGDIVLPATPSRVKP